VRAVDVYFKNSQRPMHERKPNQMTTEKYPQGRLGSNLYVNPNRQNLQRLTLSAWNFILSGKPDARDGRKLPAGTCTDMDRGEAKKKSILDESMPTELRRRMKYLSESTISIHRELFHYFLC
jgi:hypothetical protein